MNRKAKGIAGERELIHTFWDAGWAAFRCAASGSIKYPVPDIIAGNNIRKLAVEVKTIAGVHKYFPKKEISELLDFANIFGSEAWLAIKFKGKGWFFINPEDLEETPTQHSASLTLCERRGLKFEELTKN
ncbi:MAG: Holliday junction resolvase [Nanoarchaeota archaeon]|nr:Holliday junction resolvase [Nanoarchaeota archaeon]